MENRERSRSVFLKQNTSFMERMYLRMLALFPDVFPDACLVLRFGILPPAGQRSREKHVLWPRLWNLASGGSKISKKTRSLDSVLLSCLRRVKDLRKNTFREKQTRIYSIYSPYSPISAPHSMGGGLLIQS